MELLTRGSTQVAATFMLAALLTAARTQGSRHNAVTDVESLGNRVGVITSRGNSVGTQGHRAEGITHVEAQRRRYQNVASVDTQGRSIESRSLGETVQPRRLMVGDELGWRLGFDYTKWAADNEVRVTDVLVFKYNNASHTVATFKTKEDFDNCDFSDLRTNRASGFSNVFMIRVGPRYYACTVGQHCKNGMKMMIDVKPMA